MRTSALRYYEERGLIQPAARTEAGYRLFNPEAERTVHLIQRAQRIGFSLDDIQALLGASGSNDAAITRLAETRFLELERQLTELLVRRHEMEAFLLAIQTTRRQEGSGGTQFAELVERICGTDGKRPGPAMTLRWLFERTGCVLADMDEYAILDVLRGRHIHIWSDVDGAYHILVVSQEPDVRKALDSLAALERGCQAHPEPSIVNDEEGFMLTVRGGNAFLFARLFMALELESPPNQP
jgi:DNA-binding transcriptional MerR regulator